MIECLDIMTTEAKTQPGSLGISKREIGETILRDTKEIVGESGIDWNFINSFAIGYRPTYTGQAAGRTDQSRRTGTDAIGNFYAETIKAKSQKLKPAEMKYLSTFIILKNMRAKLIANEKRLQDMRDGRTQFVNDEKRRETMNKLNREVVQYRMYVVAFSCAIRDFVIDHELDTETLDKIITKDMLGQR